MGKMVPLDSQCLDPSFERCSIAFSEEKDTNYRTIRRKNLRNCRNIFLGRQLKNSLRSARGFHNKLKKMGQIKPIVQCHHWPVGDDSQFYIDFTANSILAAGLSMSYFIEDSWIWTRYQVNLAVFEIVRNVYFLWNQAPLDAWICSARNLVCGKMQCLRLFLVNHSYRCKLISPRQIRHWWPSTQIAKVFPGESFIFTKWSSKIERMTNMKENAIFPGFVQSTFQAV